MWGSLGSLRERVREHAKSAAQVAQGVLQAAALEDDNFAPQSEHASQEHGPTQQDGNWDRWDDFDQTNNPPENSELFGTEAHSTLPESPANASNTPAPPVGAVNYPAPPLSPPQPPPPPPEDGDETIEQISSRGGRRSSRYVVTGLPQPTAQQAPAPLVPAPVQLVTPTRIAGPTLAKAAPAATFVPPPQPALTPSEAETDAHIRDDTNAWEPFPQLPEDHPSTLYESHNVDQVFDEKPEVLNDVSEATHLREAPPPDKVENIFSEGPPEQITTQTSWEQHSESPQDDFFTTDEAHLHEPPPPDRAENDFSQGPEQITTQTSWEQHTEPPPDAFFTTENAESEDIGSGAKQKSSETLWEPQRQPAQDEIAPADVTGKEAVESQDGNAFDDWGVQTDDWIIDESSAAAEDVFGGAIVGKKKTAQPHSDEQADVAWFSQDPSTNVDSDPTNCDAKTAPEKSSSDERATQQGEVTDPSLVVESSLHDSPLVAPEAPKQIKEVPATNENYTSHTNPVIAADNFWSPEGDVIEGDLNHTKEQPASQDCSEFAEHRLEPSSSAKPIGSTQHIISTTPDGDLEWNAASEQQAQGEMSVEVSAELNLLREQLQALTLERDSNAVEKDMRCRDVEELQKSVAELREHVQRAEEDISQLSRERDTLRQQRDDAVEEKLVSEKERDAAIQRGGDGLREARNAIEVLRSSHSSAEQRETAISEQIDGLRRDLDRISGERNALLGEADDLRTELKETQSQGKAEKEGLLQRLQIANNEKEIALLEHEKALESSRIESEENQKILEAEQRKVSSLAVYETKVRELESYIQSNERDRDDEVRRIELFSSHFEEMKERTHGVIEERNQLYDEKLSLERDIEEHHLQHEQMRRQLLDAQREAESVAAEREEARQRYSSLREQGNDMSKRIEALLVERDQLVRQRTAAASSSTTVSENEKALVKECEQKTKMVAVLQKKLMAGSSKIEKLTVQRGTFQRQRDEAGARLRAAGAEFASINEKLNTACTARDSLQEQVMQIRDERDNALARIDELSEIASQKTILEESLLGKSKELEDSVKTTADLRSEISTLKQDHFSLQQERKEVVAEVSEVKGRLEVVCREKEFLVAQKDNLEQERADSHAKFSQLQFAEAEISKAMKALEVETTTVKEKASREIGLATAELAAEQKLRREVEAKLVTLQASMDGWDAAISDMQNTLVSSVRTAKSNADIASDSMSLSSLDWPDITDVFTSADKTKSTMELVSGLCRAFVGLSEAQLKSNEAFSSMQRDFEGMSTRLKTLEAERVQLAEVNQNAASARSEAEELRQRLFSAESAQTIAQTQCEDLQSQLRASASRETSLVQRIHDTKSAVKAEIEREAQEFGDERDRLLGDIEKITGNLKSIWVMLQSSLAAQGVESPANDLNDYGEANDSDNISVLALRATASVVAELDRSRSAIQELQANLGTAEAEVARLTDRAEIAEHERDAVRGTNEKLERKVRSARGDGLEEAQTKYEGIVSQLEDDLDDTKQELVIQTDKVTRSEKESSELRALCSKLTSQFNGRTNELDEAEEKLVYLQDQVTTLQEDLEEAHRRLMQKEEESDEARRSDVDHLTKELEETTAQLEASEENCSKLRAACDEAQSTAKECELLAETHRQAEENLQIAIEQLEAAQDSAVEQRTIDLQKKLEGAEAKCKQAEEKEASGKIAENKLSIRDEEIKELRGAIGRLADERVELKLELEQNLSRLNHPDAGGQLVDRRVVRQLLISYFRVGSVRRRDVLELMSRMLAFSDSDNIAVGLKRRALMDRLGSLVQAPELDDATLPPLGTVSDKWIEFLMNETEAGEDQTKEGW